jgi:hypothetical protein
VWVGGVETPGAAQMSGPAAPTQLRSVPDTSCFHLFPLISLSFSLLPEVYTRYQFPAFWRFRHNFLLNYGTITEREIYFCKVSLCVISFLRSFVCITYSPKRFTFNLFDSPLLTTFTNGVPHKPSCLSVTLSTRQIYSQQSSRTCNVFSAAGRCTCGRFNVMIKVQTKFVASGLSSTD